MTRRGCTYSACVKTDRPVHALGNARCPNGHDAVVLSTGHDRRGRYLEARCTAAGCGAKQLVRKVAA